MALRLRGLGLVLAAAMSLGQVRAQVQAPDPLIRARQLYNAQQYDAAIEAAATDARTHLGADRYDDALDTGRGLSTADAAALLRA